MVMNVGRLAQQFDRAGFRSFAQHLRGLAENPPEAIPDEIEEVGMDKVFRHNHFTYYPDRNTVSVKGKARLLTPTESAVLRRLTENLNKVVTFADFDNEVFHSNGVDRARHEVKFYINCLRRKLDESGVKPEESCILNVRTVGYMLR